MMFQCLKMDCQRQCAEPGFRVENKLRLNLSARAYAVLLNDIDALRTERHPAGGQGEIPSALINHIFRYFRESARSSAALALGNRRLEIGALLASVRPEDAREKAIGLLLEQDREQLSADIARRGVKGRGFSFRLDKNNLEYLVSDDGQKEREFYDDNIGRYIKSVMEEYSEHSYVERERIYYQNLVDEILLAVANKTMLKLTMRSSGSAGGIPRNNLMYVKPIGIRQDSEQLYNYLVGITASCREGPWNVGAIRFTSIKDGKCLVQPASVSRDEKKGIEDDIRTKGVQYLSTRRVEKVVVRFTPEGEQLYQRMLHLRPPFTAKPKPLVYEFECTQFQAETYFFKFGHNAKILEPGILAAKFLRRYQSAITTYQKDE